MSYYESLAIMAVMLVSGVVIGWRLVDLLPWRLRAESRLFLSPLIGLAALLHVVVLLGWIGHGYRQPVCLLVIALSVLVSLWGRRDVTTLIKNALLIVCFSVVVTAGVLYPVWKYAAMNPYNDTFTYWVHGQWLQTHGFAEPVAQSGNYPAIGLVRCFQLTGIRMGASFMLGFVQALMGAGWSYQVYPAAAAIPVAMCALVVAGTAYSVCRRMLLSLLCGAAIGLTLNGLTYGASNGFFAQTWGLAFLAGTLVLTGAVLRRTLTHSRTQATLGQWIPVGLLLSATIHAYSQISPFVIAAIGLAFLIAAFRFPRRLAALFAVVGWLGLLCLILVNLEWVRVVNCLRNESAAVVGMAVDWPWWHFISFAMGLRTGAHDVNAYLLGRPMMGVACVAGAGLIATALWWSCRNRGRTWDLMPHVTFLLLTVAAFIYFRLFAKSPWPMGTGQSWSQFKLANWATPCVFCLLAVGIAALARKSAVRSALLSVALLGILGAGAAAHIRLADHRTRQLRQDTGFSFDPLGAFFKIRQFSGCIPDDSPIYLDTGGRVGTRQMLMYALLDRPVAGNWSDDEWVKYWVREDQREQQIDQCQWIASLDSWVPPTAQRAGNLWLGPCPRTSFLLQSCDGGYPRESDQTGWWYWTSRQLHFTYQIQGESPQRIVVSFAYMTVSDQRPIHLRVGGKTQEVLLASGQQDWTSEPIELDRGGATLDVVFDCDLPPVRLSERDPRLASYLIKNLAIHRVDQERYAVPLKPTLTSGWYPVEHSGQDWLCWTDGRGQLSVVVSNDMVAELSGQILSVQRPNDVDIVVNGTKAASRRVDWTKWEFRDFRPIYLPLKAGENTVEFVSHNPPVKIEGDNRALAVAIRNLSLTALVN